MRIPKAAFSLTNLTCATQNCTELFVLVLHRHVRTFLSGAQAMTVETHVFQPAVSSSLRKPWVQPQIEDANVLMGTTAPSTDPSNAELGTAKNGS